MITLLLSNNREKTVAGCCAETSSIYLNLPGLYLHFCERIQLSESRSHLIQKQLTKDAAESHPEQSAASSLVVSYSCLSKFCVASIWISIYSI